MFGLVLPVSSLSYSSSAHPCHGDVSLLALPGDVDLGLGVVLQPHFSLTALPDDLSEKRRGHLQDRFEISTVELLDIV